MPFTEASFPSEIEDVTNERLQEIGMPLPSLYYEEVASGELDKTDPEKKTVKKIRLLNV